jgi:D-glycero-alpha-D-manno-heptose-7-phosphate kinase
LNRGPGASVTVEAPCRADLAGGTLDIWPLGLLHPGALTVNAAIPVWVRLEVDLEAPDGELRHVVDGAHENRLSSADVVTDLSAAVAFAIRPAGGVRIRVLSQASVGSGLGGSSAYGVAVARGILALTGTAMTDERLVALVRDLEARVLGVPTGVQDHWATISGGVAAVHLEPGGERVERLEVDPAWIGRRLTVFDSGISHHSGMVNWQVIRRRLEGEAATADALGGIAAAAADCRRSLLAGDEAAVARAIAEEWKHRRRLAPEVCPPELDQIEKAAAAAGAEAFKACGAGGGGSVLLWHAPESRPAIVAALQAAAPGGRVVATGVAAEGCRVVQQ